MDLTNGYTHNGNQVRLWECCNNCPPQDNNQKWFMDGLGCIHNKKDINKCLQAGDHNYATLEIWDCNGSINQLWELTSDKKIRSKKNGRYISITHGCHGVSQDNRLEMQDKHTGAGSCARQQKWHFAGYY